MDSNVSKNTFSHKFFKLRLTHENTSISIGNLLKQKLHSIFDLYSQSINFAIDPQFLYSALEPKIVPLESCIESIASNLKIRKNLLTLQLTPIVYKCSIGLALGSYLKTSPQIVAMSLASLLNFERDNIILKSGFDLYVEIAESGWINFYLDSLSLGCWLKQSWSFTKAESVDKRDLFMVCQLEQTPANLFPVQYVHARCCALLLLAARKKLITLGEDNFSNGVGQLSEPQSISWLDAQNTLWLKDLRELKLIHQLLTVTDAFTSRSVKWNKLAINLSHTAAIFISQCRFLGEIKHEYPHKAIARLGLIVLTQYWLQRVLIEKLNVAAPISL